MEGGLGYAFTGVRGRRTNGPILHGGRRGCVCTEGGGAVQGQRTGGAVHERRLARLCLAGGSVGSCMQDICFCCDMRLSRRASKREAGHARRVGATAVELTPDEASDNARLLHACLTLLRCGIIFFIRARNYSI